jgi:hypothetical protein
MQRLDIASSPSKETTKVYKRNFMKIALALPLACGLAWANGADCDMSAYKESSGLKATSQNGKLELSWSGERDEELRASFGIENGQPKVIELAARKKGASWTVLGSNMTPEFHVTTGLRRISNQQLGPLRDAGIEITPEIIEKEKWKVFWDHPLNVPGSERTNTEMPRKPEEIRRAGSKFNTSNCSVKTDGARIEVTFPGLELGVFSGLLQYTVYRGTNLLRQEAIAKTEEPSVAYNYRGGLKGLAIEPDTKVIWRDVARAWQKYAFGGAKNDDPVALRARNRLAIVESGGGSLAVFPPSHKFFFAREIELNLGFVWYRKDDDKSFSIGVRHGDMEEMFQPFGFSDALWEKRSRQARTMAMGNFALYNAPPGTWQRMGLYFYLSPNNGVAAQERVLAFTHGDVFKPLPGYQVAVSHFHTAFAEQALDYGTFDFQAPWIPVFRSLGVNIAMMSDFHGDGNANDPGDLRFQDIWNYAEACKKHSDKDFLLMPGEEPNAHLGGHYTMVLPKPVYWTKVRNPGQPFSENHPKFGKVYHTGSRADVLKMLQEVDGLVWQSHPRTKGSTFYPDLVKEEEYFKSDRYLGGAYQSLPVDLSQQRLCEERCLGVLDDMNNWAGPKYLVSEGDTYHKSPADETYPHMLVNYIKLDRLPRFDEPWTPITDALRKGDFFVTSGEVLIPSFSVEGSGAKRNVVAEVEWTFPLEFVEVVWGDGKTTGRQVVSATDLSAFGKKKFSIPFEAAGKKWVRFAAYDSAGNGALVQPVHLQ